MESRRITVLGGLILVVLTVVTGLLVFAIMQRQGEAILSTSLKLSLQSRASLFQSALESRANGVVTIATRPFLIQQINRINRDPGNPDALFALQRAVKSFLPTGFSSLAILGANGTVIAHAGDFVAGPNASLPLALPIPAKLLWKNELIFSSQIPVRDNGNTIGFIRAQARLPTLAKILFDVTTLGSTGELAVCAPLDESKMQCLPSKLHPQPFRPLSRVANNRPLPMDRALSGTSGVIRTDDYRGQEVVAAYMPASSTGLGMVLKIDASELFQPVKHQLLYVLPSVALLILLGMLMLRWLVAPLIGKVIASEQAMRRSHAQLADKETRIRAIFDNVDDGIAVINTAGAIEAVNPGTERIFGYPANELIGRNVLMLIPSPAGDGHDEPIQSYLQTDGTAAIGTAREVIAVRKDGTQFPMDLRVSEMRLGDDRLFIGTMRDITERKLAEEKIFHLATHDSLTDLPNRNLLQDRVQQAISRAQRHDGVKVALLFIDLDGFKPINDTYGHDIGDRLLVEVANRIRGIVRSEDTVARHGGDEFIVALPNVSPTTESTVVIEKLLQTLSAPYRIQDMELHISASIGLALYPDHGTNVETLLKKSDAAMYAAKLAGRGTYRIYAPEMGPGNNA